MNIYISTSGNKVILAEPIQEHAYHTKQGNDNDLPQNNREGFYVVYAEGNESFLEKYTFENAYRALTENELTLISDYHEDGDHGGNAEFDDLKAQLADSKNALETITNEDKMTRETLAQEREAFMQKETGYKQTIITMQEKIDGLMNPPPEEKVESSFPVDNAVNVPDPSTTVGTGDGSKSKKK
jgi:hypothetical protein